MNLSKLQEYSKLIAYILTAVVTYGTTLIPVGWSGWLTLIAAVLGAFAIYQASNATQDEKTANQLAAAQARLEKAHAKVAAVTNKAIASATASAVLQASAEADLKEQQAADLPNFDVLPITPVQPESTIVEVGTNGSATQGV